MVIHSVFGRVQSGVFMCEDHRGFVPGGRMAKHRVVWSDTVSGDRTLLRVFSLNGQVKRTLSAQHVH